MGELSILGKKGDTRVLWNRDNADEVEAARRQFNHLVKDRGFAAFEVSKTGEQGTRRYHEFDPAAERLVIVPQVAGGR